VLLGSQQGARADCSSRGQEQRGEQTDDDE
jgi:hypothetical protein